MKKIGEIKGIPVVEGNVNEVTKNQIHYKEEGGGITLSERKNGNLETISGSSSGGGSSRVKYYHCKDDVAMNLAGVLLADGFLSYTNCYTYDDSNNSIDTYIGAYNLLKSLNTRFAVRHIAFQPINIIVDNTRTIFNSLEELISTVANYIDINSFEEITEEQFYKID